MRKFWFVSLVALLIAAIRSGWPPAAAVAVILNGLVVLINVIARIYGGGRNE